MTDISDQTLIETIQGLRRRAHNEHRHFASSSGETGEGCYVCGYGLDEILTALELRRDATATTPLIQAAEGLNPRTRHGCGRENCGMNRNDQGQLYWALRVCGHGGWPCGVCRYPIHPKEPCPGRSNTRLRAWLSPGEADRKYHDGLEGVV
jgi:hypothetical protein